MNELEKSYHDCGLWTGILIGFVAGCLLAVTIFYFNPLNF